VTPELKQRFVTHLLRICGLILLGTCGYMLIEHWRVLDALYMTVLTLTTVGYQEVHHLSDNGRIYTMVFILCGVGMFLNILRDMVQIIIDASSGITLRQLKMKQTIDRLTEHQIVCGYGRTGQEVIEQFLHYKHPFVIIESNPDTVKVAEQRGLLVLEGDASSDEVLMQAGIKRAKGIVCALPDDTDNTFVALSARGLNADITIVSRAANPGAESKLKRAGAHMVISPYVICGRRMAAAVTHPLITEFLDVVMHSQAYDLQMEQVIVEEDSILSGINFKEADLKHTAGAMILAVSQNGVLVNNPSPDLIFQAGNVLIALGTQDQLEKLGSLAAKKIHRNN